MGIFSFMYLIISLLVFVCILLFLKFIPKESNNTIIKDLNKGIKNANEYEDFPGYTSAILLISFLFFFLISISLSAISKTDFSIVLYSIFSSSENPAPFLILINAFFTLFTRLNHYFPVG